MNDVAIGGLCCTINGRRTKPQENQFLPEIVIIILAATVKRKSDRGKRFRTYEATKMIQDYRNGQM